MQCPIPHYTSILLLIEFNKFGNYGLQNIFTHMYTKSIKGTRNLHQAFEAGLISMWACGGISGIGHASSTEAIPSSSVWWWDVLIGLSRLMLFIEGDTLGSLRPAIDPSHAGFLYRKETTKMMKHIVEAIPVDEEKGLRSSQSLDSWKRKDYCYQHRYCDLQTIFAQFQTFHHFLLSLKLLSRGQEPWQTLLDIPVREQSGI